jgi:GNAT superfamily N-acetyltransferase
MALVCKPATPGRWKDLESLFEQDTTCSGCWCMWIRLPSAEYRKGFGAGNKAAMRKLVKSGAKPGVIAYQEGRPVGWAALAPRAAFRRLENSRTLKPVDGEPVWSVPCFFTAKEARGQGATVALLKAAAKQATSAGAKVLEGYPVDTRGKKLPAGFVWWGLAPAFRKAGFKEALRRSKTRPIMRKTL